MENFYHLNGLDLGFQCIPHIIMRHAVLPTSDIDLDFPARLSYRGKHVKNTIKCTYIIYKP